MIIEGVVDGTYAHQAARQVGLKIPPEYEAGVLLALKALSDSAELLLAFPIPDDIEPASIFLSAPQVR